MMLTNRINKGFGTKCHYTTFGSPLPGRQFNSGNYRYGFNGHEKDNEISGNGNSNTAEFWQYDSRLGRRWNVDPKRNASFSNYSTFNNNPICFSDPKGDTVKFNPGIPQDHRLMQNIADLRKKNKQFDMLYSKLDNSKTIYNVDVRSLKDEKAEGVFYPENQTIVIDQDILLSDDKGRVRSTVAEEFFHAYQYNYYGPKLFGKISKEISIESEAKIFTSTLANNEGFSRLSIQEGKMYEELGGFTPGAYYYSFLYANRSTINNYTSVLNGTVLNSRIASSISNDFIGLYKSIHQYVFDAYNERKNAPTINKNYTLQTGAFESLFR